MNKEEFGAKLKALRKEHNMSVLELAKAVGVDKQDIYQIESGGRAVSNPKKNKILEIFNLEYQEVTSIIEKKSK